MNGPPCDSLLLGVANVILNADPAGIRCGEVLRKTFDQLYDGQHTGRYRWDQLHKTEKTHFGTLVEINLHREFHFKDGAALDYQICDTEVDCKYSQTFGGWMIPPEANGHICLLVWADDRNAHWSMGLVRVDSSRLNSGANRDGKATLNSSGKEAIYWIFKDAALPPNILLQLDRGIVERIMALDSGQKRVNEIFRVAQHKPIGRGVIATLAQQEDYMKRIRGNGGARSSLREEGIIILGQYKSHMEIARSLHLPIPGPGESVSARVTPALGTQPGCALISGSYWCLASESDPPVQAPLLPGQNPSARKSG